MNQSVSQISVSSRYGSSPSQKHKELASTKNDSRHLELESCYSGLSVEGNGNLLVTKSQLMQKRIATIQSNQNQLERKFQKVIESLLKEINQKQQANECLERQISDLKIGIQESKNDLKIITGYLKKKQLKQSETLKRKNVINLSHRGAKLQKSTSGKKIDQSDKGEPVKVQKKSKSPRLLLFKKGLFQ